MSRPTYDIAISDPFRPSLIAFLTDVAQDVTRTMASEDTDAELRDRLPEYLEWAQRCLTRLEVSDDGYVKLDEMDIEVLRKDILPSMIGKGTDALDVFIDGRIDRHGMQLVLDEMREANRLCGRLHQIVNFDLFDETFTGDRPSIMTP